MRYLLQKFILAILTAKTVEMLAVISKSEAADWLKRVEAAL